MPSFKSYPNTNTSHPINFAGFINLQVKKTYLDSQVELLKQQISKLVKGV